VNQQNATGRIEGKVVVQGPARGNTVLFLFDAANPPPPVGTGAPLTFTVVPKMMLFGNADGNGPFSAPFAFSLVKPGNYLIRGLIDANDDFIPWYKVTADANKGDVGGAAADPKTLAMRVITADPVALNVSVAFSGDLTTVPIDRPSFQVVGQTLSATLSNMPIVLDLAPQPIDMGVVHETAPVFLAQFIDDDHDGVPDDRNMDGVPDMWPKAIVRKIADGENLLADDQGDYEHYDPTHMRAIDKDGTPDVVVLAAGIDPTDIAPMLLDMNGKVKPTPTPVGALKLVVKPLALDAANPLKPVPLAQMPPGRYAINLISVTGQTWRVPNELAPAIAMNVGLPSVMSQAFVIQVP
jgi:hypothetical protein